jgi:hypothetical protein
MNDSPRPYTISPGGRVYPIPVADLEYDNPLQDPRGIIWLWEPPHSRANYVMGVDPTFGITGWDRAFRTQDDKRVHNGAIELIRVGNGLPGMDDFSPDVQVGEYAAPIDPEDLADVANLLGRLYSGRDEDGQSLSIVEVHPGPGLVTQRRLINTHGYTNHFVWKTQDAGVTQDRARPVGTLPPPHPQRGVRGTFPVAGGGVAGRRGGRVLAARQKVPRPASDMSEESLMDAWEERWEEISEM